jgi:hypothetical protein
VKQHVRFTLWRSSCRFACALLLPSVCREWPASISCTLLPFGLFDVLHDADKAVSATGSGDEDRALFFLTRLTSSPLLARGASEAFVRQEISCSLGWLSHISFPGWLPCVVAAVRSVSRAMARRQPKRVPRESFPSGATGLNGAGFNWSTAGQPIAP